MEAVAIIHLALSWSVSCSIELCLFLDQYSVIEHCRHLSSKHLSKVHSLFLTKT
jgi:hypothetical protein